MLLNIYYSNEMMNAQLYSQPEVLGIIHAYGQIFPSISPALADYWGHGRERPWSCLTSDFHNVRYEQFAALHEEASRIDATQFLNLDAKGNALRNAALTCGVGYSLGINAWTDNLLHRTYQDDLSSLTILLAHDWYPIATTDRKGEWRRSDAPLRADDNLHCVKGYHAGAPEHVLHGDTVGLFLNLYPDYRPPGVDKMGNLGKYGYSYARCLAGLDELVAALSPRYTHINIVSWGADVWKPLSTRTNAPNKIGLTAYTRNLPGQPLVLELGGRRLPYLPLVHPSFKSNFSQPEHYYHLAQGFLAMGLGLPGSTRWPNKCTADARAAALPQYREMPQK